MLICWIWWLRDRVRLRMRVRRVQSPKQRMNTPPGVAHTSYGLAALCAIGGVSGYAMRKSVPSLAGGLAFGAAFAACGWMIGKGGDHTTTGFAAATATSSALALGMVPRYRKTQKVFPAGVLIGVGVLGAIYHGYQYGKWS